MKISVIHASRGRSEQSFKNIDKWSSEVVHKLAYVNDIEYLISLDEDDGSLDDYKSIYKRDDDFFKIIVNKNRSSIEAINKAAAISKGDILMVVSDDTECINHWDFHLVNDVKGRTDWILKTQDGIQSYIITNPIMDRAYYNRTGYIYHPDFKHLFCDTYMTCVADITGRKITSNLMFKHNHYSVNGTPPDELHKRNDATWKQGEETFIRLMKQFTKEERDRIKDVPMRNWLRQKGL